MTDEFDARAYIDSGLRALSNLNAQQLDQAKREVAEDVRAALVKEQKRLADENLLGMITVITKATHSEQLRTVFASVLCSIFASVAVFIALAKWIPR